MKTGSKKITPLKGILLSAVIAFLLMAVLVVYLPYFLGYECYYVSTGSMSPTINFGSLVMTENITFDELKIGDILTFHSDDENKHFTHRVVSIDTATQMLTTKGDANNDVDPQPTNFQMARGRVVIVIPVIGFIAMALGYDASKIIIALIFIIWLAIIVEQYFNKKRKGGTGDEI